VRVLAYLDANSGSLIASAIAAGGAGVAVAARMKWQQIRKPFSRRGGDEEAVDTEPVDEEAVDTEPVDEDA
jgi:hypothetical protein